MRIALFSGMKRSNTVPESDAIENRDIVRGSKAIWKRMANLEPYTNGGAIRFAHK
jgi:hypothetical protein